MTMTVRQVAGHLLLEREFERQVTDLAEIFGWSWVHFRPAQTSRGWRTAVSGPLGQGWPDLVLVRRHRLILAEIKAEKGRISEEQTRTLEILRGLTVDGFGAPTNVECFVWKPSDMEAIAEILR